MEKISLATKAADLKHYRQRLGGWQIASLLHCILFALQQGLLITYLFNLAFGIAGYIAGKFSSYSLLFTLIAIVKNAPYWLYGTLLCLLCFHMGRVDLRKSRVILYWSAILAVSHQAMIVKPFMVLFYLACMFGTISALLRLGIFKKTYLFDWPLCKQQTKYPFNMGILIVTIVVSTVICMFFSIPEILNMPILPIISILFKMEFLENFTEYYDLAYAKIYSKIM